MSTSPKQTGPCARCSANEDPAYRMACGHPLPAVVAKIWWQDLVALVASECLQCSDWNPPRLYWWIQNAKKHTDICWSPLNMDHETRFIWPYLQGFRILWLLCESYGGILMWKLSNLDSSKWFSIIRGTSNSQSSWLWHHLDQWQNSNKITVPLGGLNET